MYIKGVKIRYPFLSPLSCVSTFLANRIELMDVRHGNITIGKLTATDNANPIFVISTPKESGNAVRMLPEM